METIKIYTVSKKTEGPKLGEKSLNFIHGTNKVQESEFNELLDKKIKELLGEENMGQYYDVEKKVFEALNSKTPVTILDTCFEIKFKKSKSHA